MQGLNSILKNCKCEEMRRYRLFGSLSARRTVFSAFLAENLVRYGWVNKNRALGAGCTIFVAMICWVNSRICIKKRVSWIFTVNFAGISYPQQQFALG